MVCLGEVLWKERAEGEFQEQNTQMGRNSVYSTASGTTCFANSAVVNCVYVFGRVGSKTG